MSRAFLLSCFVNALSKLREDEDQHGFRIVITLPQSKIDEKRRIGHTIAEILNKKFGISYIFSNTDLFKILSDYNIIVILFLENKLVFRPATRKLWLYSKDGSCLFSITSKHFIEMFENSEK